MRPAEGELRQDEIEVIRSRAAGVASAESYTLFFKAEGRRVASIDVPKLLIELDRLREENERLSAEVEHVKSAARMGLNKWREMVAVVPGWWETAAKGFDEVVQAPGQEWGGTEGEAEERKGWQR